MSSLDGKSVNLSFGYLAGYVPESGSGLAVGAQMSGVSLFSVSDNVPWLRVGGRFGYSVTRAFAETDSMSDLPDGSYNTVHSGKVVTDTNMFIGPEIEWLAHKYVRINASGLFQFSVRDMEEERLWRNGDKIAALTNERGVARGLFAGALGVEVPLLASFSFYGRATGNIRGDIIGEIGVACYVFNNK